MVGSGPALITTPLTERGIAVPNLPRIEAIDVDAAVCMCCDLLHFVAAASRSLSETDSMNSEAWQGLSWLVEAISNTLTEVEVRNPSERADA